MVLSLGKKMGIGFGVVILLIIINSTVSIKSLKSVIHGFEGKVMVEKDIQLKSEKLRIELLQIRRREKDFMSRKDMQYSDLVNKYLNNTRSIIAEMENTSSSTVIMPKLSKLKNEIDKYAVDFTKLVQVVAARGLTENDGVQGEFRTAAHRFETAVRTNPIRNGQRLYLTARKHEKDYMLRGAKKYIDRIKKVIEQLRKIY
jgi:methyl-accepting chemotaxis protein